MTKLLSVAGNCLITVVVFIGTITPAFGLKTLSKSPYVGAVVMDADTGRVISEDHADARGYPASMIKLMNLLVILEAVEAGHISLSEPVTVSARVSRMGGSQVYLKEKEVFPVEELIYAMIVQSANDAALGLALHYAGTEEAFVDLMNQRASEIGMKNTVFHTVHGLPPAKNQEPDVTTARDMALLCRELLKYPDVLKYTSTKVREFRPDAKEPFIMRTHNHLLKDFEGCDGFKTGYYRAAGFSIAATAQKGDSRTIAVILGSPTSKERDRYARLFMSKGLMDIMHASSSDADMAEIESTAAEVPESASEPDEEIDYVMIPRNIFNIALTLNAVVILFLVAILYAGRGRRKNGRLR